ncbi:hypothetical protein FRC03_008359 [Tulasnella sp. 419]|nr:hypothetical protein FRC03_008359 [Tulasnella sp. 419]
MSNSFPTQALSPWIYARDWEFRLWTLLFFYPTLATFRLPVKHVRGNVVSAFHFEPAILDYRLSCPTTEGFDADNDAEHSDRSLQVRPSYEANDIGAQSYEDLHENLGAYSRLEACFEAKL